MNVSGSQSSETPTPGVALSKSIGSDSLDLFVAAGDTALDALISSGALDGVPVIDLLSGSAKAIREVRDQLYLRKVVRFLQGVHKTTQAERFAFTQKLERDGEFEYFGETILLILERIDDAQKPAIIGRILAAHISGTIPSYNQAMRLVAIVNRVYAADLAYLSSFRPGVQRDHDVAASLSAAGLLANTGIDGGGVDQEKQPGGYTYDLNEYGRLLIAHGLK